MGHVAVKELRNLHVFCTLAHYFILQMNGRIQVDKHFEDCLRQPSLILNREVREKAVRQQRQPPTLGSTPID